MTFNIKKFSSRAGIYLSALLILQTAYTLFPDVLSLRSMEEPTVYPAVTASDVISPADVISSEEAEPEPVELTAYSRVIPPEGDCAELIAEYIEYEHSIMSPDELVFTFTGDCTVGTWPESNPSNNYTKLYSESGSPTYSFDNVKSLFANDDYTYVNLETTLTNSEERFTGKSFNFKGDPAWAETMIKASFIDGCNVANNHSIDYSQSGYDETVSVCCEAGLDVGDYDKPVKLEIGGMEFVLLQGCYIYENAKLKDHPYSDELTEILVSQIKQYKREDNIVIVNCHWGYERNNKPTLEQKSSARAFIDAGADIIIGHHPHTLQSVELYNGHYIFYSLGNFAFGGKTTTDEVNRPAIVVRPRFALRDGKAEITGVFVLPCYTTSAEDIGRNNYKPRLLSGNEAKKVIRTILSFSSYVSNGVSSLDAPTADFE